MGQFLIVLLQLHLSAALEADTDERLTIYTEEFPPYNYIDGEGKLAGISYKSVQKIITAAGFAVEFVVLPWPRAVRAASTDQIGLIFSLARSSEREASYDWLAYLSQPNFFLYARADEHRLVTLDAIKHGRFTAICEESDISCSLLASVGFPHQSLIKIKEGSLSEVNMVLYGRADLYLEDTNSFTYRMKKLGLATDATKKVLRVGGGLEFYLAAGHHVNPMVRNKIRGTYQQLVKAGELRPAPSQIDQ